MKKRIISLMLAAVMTLALGACTGKTEEGGGDNPGGSTEVKANEVIVGLYDDLDASLDPHMSSSSAGTREILFNIYEGLVKPDSEGNLIPAVADNWTASETADEYTFHIREGVLFHDGKELSVEDVVWSLSRAAGLETGSPLVSDVAGIEAVTDNGDGSITIQLKAPDAEFLAHATVAIMPAESDPAAAVVGTGPFKYVERVVQDHITLEKFDGYWGEAAKLDKVTLRIIEDPETLVMSLRSGAVDMAVRMNATQVASITNMNLLEGSSNIVQALYLNNDRAPFNDIRVRQALCYALDKQEIIDLSADGHGAAVGSSMFPAFGKYFMPELTDYYTKNIVKAKELLAEAGYADGFEFSITVPSTMQMHVDAAQVISDMLREIGITARIDQVEWTAWYTDTYQARDFQATVVGMDAHGVAASDMLARFVSTSSKNFINYSSEEYDAAYAAATSTTDDAAQTASFKECEEILTRDAANVYIQDPASFTVMAKGLEGYRFYPLYVFDLSTIYWAE